MTPWLLLSMTQLNDPEWVEERELEAKADYARESLRAAQLEYEASVAGA